MLSWNLCVSTSPAAVGKFMWLYVVIREKHRRKSATVCFVLFLRHKPFQFQADASHNHGLLTPTASCDSQPLPGTGPNKQNGSQQAINFLLAQNFSATSASSGLLVCALDHHAWCKVYGVRCYARRLGASGCNAHAKAQAALGPGLRRTSHAIVQPLRPPFLSFSLPPSALLCSPFRQQ